MAVEGDTIVVGAPARGDQEGAVYVFRRTAGAWTQEAVLESPAPVSYARFGAAVALSGDTVVVGAPNGLVTSPPPGHAYVFVRAGTTWSLQQELEDPSPALVGGRFGAAIAIEGDTAVVTKLPSSIPANAHVFARAGTTWTHQAQLDGDAYDFGSSADISGDTIVIGARDEDGARGESDVGAAYVFVGAGASWTREARLVPTGTSVESFFGSSVALAGDLLAVGGAEASTTTEASGAVVMFERSGAVWTEQPRLMASNASLGDAFGLCALAPDLLAVGAPWESSEAFRSGAVYLFAPDVASWSQVGYLKSPHSAALGEFSRTALSEDLLVVGAPGQDEVLVYDR